jgi:hypothetical protein
MITFAHLRAMVDRVAPCNHLCVNALKSRGVAKDINTSCAPINKNSQILNARQLHLSPDVVTNAAKCGSTWPNVQASKTTQRASKPPDARLIDDSTRNNPINDAAH